MPQYTYVIGINRGPAASLNLGVVWEPVSEVIWGWWGARAEE